MNKKPSTLRMERGQEKVGGAIFLDPKGPEGTHLRRYFRGELFSSTQSGKEG